MGHIIDGNGPAILEGLRVTRADHAHLEQLARNHVAFVLAALKLALSLEDGQAFVRAVLGPADPRYFVVALGPDGDVVGQALVLPQPHEALPGKQVWAISYL